MLTLSNQKKKKKSIKILEKNVDSYKTNVKIISFLCVQIKIFCVFQYLHMNIMYKQVTKLFLNCTWNYGLMLVLVGFTDLLYK
jgi:hypothetical protein